VDASSWRGGLATDEGSQNSKANHLFDIHPDYLNFLNLELGYCDL
jgi:hypothetical protein